MGPLRYRRSNKRNGSCHQAMHETDPIHLPPIKFNLLNSTIGCCLLCPYDDRMDSRIQNFFQNTTVQLGKNTGCPKKRRPFVHHRKNTYIYPLVSTYFILIVDIPKKFSLEYGWLKQET
jgi:hypothetical protein